MARLVPAMTLREPICSHILCRRPGRARRRARIVGRRPGTHTPGPARKIKTAATCFGNAAIASRPVLRASRAT